ncbi:MAG: Mu transposase C-terminal domain-containing protein [Thermodesulfobacteriota bacterium]
MLPVLGRRDEDLTEPNERWEIDTTLADLMTDRKVEGVSLITSDGKRCKVIGVIDVFSRALKFVLTEKECGFSVGQLLKDRILSWGVPEELVIDNGRSFKNRRILNFLRKIGTAVHICLPANPVEKPFIERAFRTLTEEVFRGLEGYVGNCIANRPDEIEVKYTMTGLQEIINRWVANIYDERIHGTTGQRPRERRNPPGFIPKTIDERVLDVLLMEEHKRTVRQGRVCYLGDSYFHKSLPEGQKVKIRVDDSDASQVIVYSNGEYLCTATNFSRKGITPSDIREARKERSRELRTRIKAHKALLVKYDNVETGVIARIEEAEKKKPVELPRKAEVVRFPAMQSLLEGETRADQEQCGLAADLAGSIHERPWFTGERHKYTWLRRREKAGLGVTEEDRAFMEEFRDSGFYQTVGQAWERRLDQIEEASNEG